MDSNILEEEVVTGDGDVSTETDNPTGTEPTPEPEPIPATGPTYSYNPAQIYDDGLNQMRFELQDNIIEGEGVTCALCDEEYMAIIEHE